MKYLFITFLIIFHSASFAKWHLLGVTKDAYGDREEYYDDELIGKGNFPKLWILRNYKQGYKDPQGDVYFSSKNLYEFSCSDRQIRNLNITQYSDTFGKGSIVFQTSPGYKNQWSEVLPESISMAYYSVVCKK
jgi:hypothetical protein